MSLTSEITSRNDQQLSLEDAIALVHANAHQTWKEEAERVVRDLCRTHREFSAKDAWERLQHVHTTDNRALGAVIQNSERAGLCRFSGKYIASRLPQQNRRPIRVWESVELRESIPR